MTCDINERLRLDENILELLKNSPVGEAENKIPSKEAIKTNFKVKDIMEQKYLDRSYIAASFHTSLSVKPTILKSFQKIKKCNLNFSIITRRASLIIKSLVTYTSDHSKDFLFHLLLMTKNYCTSTYIDLIELASWNYYS